MKMGLTEAMRERCVIVYELRIKGMEVARGCDWTTWRTANIERESPLSRRLGRIKKELSYIQSGIPCRARPIEEGSGT
jgi:hypothetical protein